MTALASTVLALFGPSSRSIAGENETQRFDVVARKFEASRGKSTPGRFVFLVSGPATEVTAGQPIAMNDDEIRTLAIRSLRKAGYEPAQRAEEAELAIAVGYGRGEYVPPFEFMDVDPSFTPHHMWPALLKVYDESYRRLDYANADITGFPAKREAATGELFNVLIIRAFDAAALRQAKKWVLRWETRVTIGATEGAFEKLLPGMLVAAESQLGQDARNGTSVRLPLRTPQVDIGELSVVETDASAKPAADAARRPEPKTAPRP